jgi:site-specific recombinase XerD
MQMKISVRPGKVRGQKKWIVSYTLPGEKRKRLFFDTKSAAETEQQTLETQQKRSGDVWFAMSAERRDEIVRLMADAVRDGFTVREAVDYFRTHRDVARRNIAVGKAWEKFMQEKEAELIAPKSKKALKSNVGRFVKGRELLPLRSITREDVLGYLRRPEWGPRTFNTYLISLNTFFLWCVKVEHLEKAPTETIDPIDEKRLPDLDVAPVIIGLDQSEALLRATLQTDPGLTRFVALCLFAGLRPEREAPRVAQSDIFNGVVRVKGLHAKDRQRRDVEIHPTLQAWLDLGGDVHAKNLRKRFERVREAAGLVRIERATGKGKTRKLVDGKLRKKIVNIGWAQDCLRHTFASNWHAINGAESTIRQLGHGNYDMLFGHYLSLVKRENAEAFWKLTPDYVRARISSTALAA